MLLPCEKFATEAVDIVGAVMRSCTMLACPDDAAVTLTYDYADRVAVLGPLSPEPARHAHDLCRRHARRFTAPAGWHVIRHLNLTND